MKPIMITLLYLTAFGDIKLDSFEIHSSCESWYHYNVKVEEIPMPKDIAKNYQAYTCADNKKLQDILNYEFEYVIDWIDRQ